MTMAQFPLFVRFLRTSLWRYRWWFLGGVLFLYVTNWIAVQIPLEIKHAIDHLQEGEADSQAQLHTIALSILGLGALLVIVRTLSRLLFFTPGRFVERDIRETVFQHLLALQPDYYDHHAPGEIVSKLTNDIAAVRALAGYATLQGVNVVMGISLVVYRMIEIDPSITLYCLLPVAILFITIQGGLRRMFDLVRRSQVALARLSEEVLGSYNGITTIRSFNAETTFEHRFHQSNDAVVALTVRLGTLRAFLIPLLSLMGSMAIVVLLYLGGALVTRGRLTVGELAAMLGLIAVMLPAIMSLGWLLTVIQRGRSALERLYEIVDTPPTLPTLTTAADRMPTLTPRSEPLPEPLIESRHLSFTYPENPAQPDHPLVLTDISFAVHPGEVIGIFGQTGAGKSTLLSLLLRLYNPPAGTIFFNGRDSLSYPLDTYRQFFSFVPQRPFLFSDTIAGNIALGSTRPLDDQALHRLIEISELGRDIATFPDGLNTLVGPRGMMLSGGQRQRLALARALASDAPVVILDDVLSAVDHATEERLIARLYDQHRTILIVSHRLSVLRRASRILVLEQGRITAQGTHESLLRQNELYARVWQRQQMEEHLVEGAR